MAEKWSKLSDTQKKAISEIKDMFDAAFVQASTKLERAGFDGLPDAEGFNCEVDDCRCHGYVHNPRPGGLCARPGCRHFIGDHNFPI